MKKKYNNITIYTFLYREHERLSKKLIHITAKNIDFYSRLIGPYPYEKFAIVETFLPVGVSYPSYTLIGKSIIDLPFLSEVSLPHEILHCWFGNGVFIKYSEGNWAEGLVSYLSDYLKNEQKSKDDAIKYRWKLIKDYSTLVNTSNEIPLKDFFGRVNPETRAIGYGKSAMTFHLIRKLLGDDNFFKSLKNFYKDFLFKYASWDDIIGYFVKTLGDKNLKKIITPWITEKGIPDFFIENAKKTKKENSWELEVTIKQKDTVFIFPLDVVIMSNDKRNSLKSKISIDDKKNNFKFNLNFEPYMIILDPEKDILRRLEKNELPPSINMLKSASSIYIVKTKNYKGTQKSIDILISTLGLKNFSFIDEQDLYDQENNILFLGIPDILIFKEINNITKNNDFNNHDHVIFLIKKGRKENFLALFYPISEKSSEEVAHKISHYGEFNFVVFKNGINIKKEALEPDFSRIIYKFN